ncbi:MAG: hypothetical protein JWN34_5024 [Bryobacterales bacterium]|jgi:hypothetical protein|nr:hypothetical protein [Bryobacterales bacterium]
MRPGLCETCIYQRRITSEKGSVFYLCERGLKDPSFPKYPRLPVLRCSGFEEKDGRDGLQRQTTGG